MTLQASEINFEVLIVGAGISGIIAAQRYLEVHPTCNLTIVEKDHCVGGVFSKRRLYNEFWTQWTVGIAEFADMPMERPPEEDCRSDCFKAKYTTEYLEKYIDEKRHSGRSLRDKIQFGTQVNTIEKSDGKWNLSCTNSKSNKVVFSATKLMLANGENSLPNIPNIPGKESFEGLILHSQDFGSSNVISSPSIQHISVLGAGKSSADMIYEALQAGKTVSWIIRKTGTGPGFFAPLDMKTPYQNAVEAAQTRIMSSLQPSIANPENWWTWFLHSTWIGARIVSWIFGTLDKEVRKRADYKGRESKRGFAMLEYQPAIFWQNNTGGALHHPDFWPLVAEKVTVYREDIERVSNKTLHLTSGSQIPCDGLLCGTGWKPGLEFFSPSILSDLGLPHKQADEPPSTTSKWAKLSLSADQKITKRFPILANPPPHYQTRLDTTPYRLYNCMAPLTDDSILFMNHVTAGNKLFAAEAQAMWAVAYFDGNIKLPSIEEREERISLWIAWTKRRYLSRGQLGTFAAFDSVGYVDGLLEEIGLSRHWEGKGWLGYWVEVFRPGDLGMAWSEYLERVRKEQ